MALIQFVQNYQDLSTDKGYQFKFHCDKCGNGFMTRFQASTFGLAESALAIAGSLFGGAFNTARNAEYEIQRAVGGKAHDSALESAVVEGKEHFHQCGRCGRWVCPEVCWNAESNLCDGCAPKLAQEMAANQAQAKAMAARQQLQAKAAQTDYVADVDMRAGAGALRAPDLAPHAPVAAPTGAACGGCGTALAPNAKFCAQCGQPQKPAGCSGCGTALQPGAHFCPQCGQKVA
jgi:uncharacterized OB-fold protein